MKNGMYQVYYIKFRRVAESASPEGPIRLMKKPWDWIEVGRDSVENRFANPHVGSGNDWRPANRVADSQLWRNWHGCEIWGWTDAKFAEAAMDRLLKADVEGKLDDREYDSQTGRLIQQCRHEFCLCFAVVVYSRTDTLDPTPSFGEGHALHKKEAPVHSGA